MIVLHAAPLDFSRPNGISVSVPQLVRAQSAIPGVDAGLLNTFSAPAAAKSERYGVPVFDFRDIGRVANLPKPFDTPDLVVFHNTYVSAHAALGREARRRRIPYIVTPRGGLTTDSQRVRWPKKLIGNVVFLRRFVRRAAAVHCLTVREARLSAAWNGSTFVVGNGAVRPSDVHVAKPGQGSLIRYRYIGRLDPHHKGLDRLLRACALFRDELMAGGARVELWGSDHRGGKATVEKLVRDGDLHDLVSLNGPVAGDAKNRVLREGDVFVHTSRFEGHPLAVLEALAHGLPCMLTVGTNVSAEVQAMGAGWEVGDQPRMIGRSMLSILDRKDDLPRMGGAALELIRTRYTWPVVAQETVRHYERILHGSRNTSDSD